MSDNQHGPDSDPDSDVAPAEGSEASQEAATDLLKPDFSRLRLARASLDAAFPQQ